MERLDFSKYEGTGNDFVLVEAPSDRVVSPERARALCDRHFGIGADGVILVVPAGSAGARARMVVLNADGSRPEMCGNGLRCVALLLAEREGREQTEFVVETDAGERLTRVERSGAAGQVTIGMGRGRLVAKERFPVRGKDCEFLRVDMGNPHAVAFVEGVDEAELDRVGPAISAAIPGGTNVEVVTFQGPRSIDLLVWERGVGRTLACGTGAAAVAVAAAMTGRSPYGEPLEVRLPGGALVLTVAEGSLEVTMRGPARHVFSGQVRP
ncbi:MAG TPA: diaminopimelate epimerase [Polyangiaceae bacterium]